MIRAADIAAFLASRGVAEKVEFGGGEVEMPDRVVFVNQTGGAGESKERAFERATVQVRCRGAQNDPADAEALADQVDRALMDVAYPVTIGGRHVTSIQWVGGPPALVGRDDARRSELAASYVVEIAR